MTTLIPLTSYYRREQREILGRALSSLRESGRQIITLHYHRQEWQMRQIAQAMNVYESCISQPSGVTLERVSVLLAVPVQR